ncbi:hypothetical protein [Streptomyces bobili]|uniref:hypothetical protein n=1 Tax=Streptomyces bobili TaxID=67280 RepID=UPI000A3870B0|nr:hypothetical protein [Streptomyces bobili]
MTDWTRVVDAHGAVGRVPLLLDRVEREEAPEAWEELWDRLCLHGETVSAASFAALPRLAALAPTSAQALELAGAIVRGTLRHPDAEALLASCSNEVARLRQLVDQRLRTRPADYNRLFGDLLALAGHHHWSASLGDFDDDFYAVSCPRCEAEVTIAVGDYGCYSAMRDWDRGDVERRTLRPAPAEELRDPGRWMHATAGRDGQHRLAEGIRHVFGCAECPACGTVFSIAEAHTAANLPPVLETYVAAVHDRPAGRRRTGRARLLVAVNGSGYAASSDCCGPW